MNRNNIWVHIGIAAVLISFAAVIGQIDRWRAGLRVQDTTPVSRAKVTKPTSTARSSAEGEPEVLVRFRSGLTVADIKRIASRGNDRVEDEIESVNGLVAIDDLDNADAVHVARQYESMSEYVVYAEPNYDIRLDDPVNHNARSRGTAPVSRLGVPNDPQFNEQWALNNTGQNGGKANAHIDALKAWAKTQGSEEVVVAVLDTGVDYNHRDLVANMWSRPDAVPQYFDDELGGFDDARGFDASENAPDPMDDNGHGTHVAGIIGAEGDNSEGIAGINWTVQIMPLKFLGRGGFGSTKNAIEAINYAIDRKKNGVNLRVINASWGSTQRSKALEDAIRAAGDAGILFVAAAGNSSTDNDRRPHFPSNYDLPNMVSVAALDRNDLLANFSNYGAKSVHVAAPGREILSTWLGDQYREASGTSMAAPQVAGISALIVANEPKLSMSKLRERVLKSSDPIDTLLGKVVAGGRLNAAKALGE